MEQITTNRMAYNNRNKSSHNSRSPKSKVKVWAGPPPSGGSWEDPSCLFQLLGAQVSWARGRVPPGLSSLGVSVSLLFL